MDLDQKKKWLCPFAHTTPEKIALITNHKFFTYGEINQHINAICVEKPTWLERKGNFNTLVLLFALLRRGLSIDFSKTVPMFAQEIRDTINPTTSVFLESSGTTGAPKKVEWEIGAFIENLRAQYAAFPIFEEARHRAQLDWSRMGGFSALLRPLFSQGTVVLDPEIEVDFESVVPTQIVKRFSLGFAAQTLIIGGAPLPFSTTKLLHQMPQSVVILYSSTELGTCFINGQPLPGVEVDIDTRQTIWIRKGHTAKYIDRENFYQTFDQVKKPYAPFEIIGRANRVIHTGGEKVLLSYIEEKLQEFFPHGIFHAFATPDPLWGEALALGFFNETPLNIERALRESLPRYMIPKHFVTLPKETPPKPSLLFLQSLIVPNVDPQNPDSMSQIQK